MFADSVHIARDMSIGSWSKIHLNRFHAPGGTRVLVSIRSRMFPAHSNFPLLLSQLIYSNRTRGRVRGVARTAVVTMVPSVSSPFQQDCRCIMPVEVKSKVLPNSLPYPGYRFLCAKNVDMFALNTMRTSSFQCRRATLRVTSENLA